MALKEIEKLREKVEKDPNSKLFVPLAEEYKKEGMLDEAIQVLLTGIERQPGYMSARVSLGKIYLEKGMRDEARAEFESVIESIPDNLYAHKKLAEIYRDAGETELAAKSYRTILRLNSMDEDALTSLHELEAGNSPGEPGEALAVGQGGEEEQVPAGDVGEVAPEEAHPEDVAPEQPEPAGGDELSAFKESLFGSGGAGDSSSEEIIAEDLPEDDAVADSVLTAGDEDIEDVPADVALEEDLEEIGEISVADEDVPAEEISGAGVDASPAYAQAAVPEGEEDNGTAGSVSIEEADDRISEADYGGAIRIYRKILSENPDDRQAMQRLEELRSLLKMLGRDKEELMARLNGFLEGIQKKHNEFLGRT